jgi:beta-galactosidase
MIGVCYYPEHWPESRWAADAGAMAEFGITYVRIGEFAWSRYEPEPGVYDWDWLQRAIDTLAAAGLKVVLGTPTAGPPKWLTDLYPDILPVSADGKVLGHGARRHATVSSQNWLRESRRIVTAMAERFGDHPAVVGWQLDNEIGSDGTAWSYGPADLAAYRQWLRTRYQHIGALNEAWANVFWSMELRSFDEVGLPVGAVWETNPAARLDYWRFSSESLARYIAMQAEIVRAHAPGRFITSNFMSFFHDFDHFDMAKSLDFASWDSYPLGKVQHGPLRPEERARWHDTSHPDFSSFHHDLYRGLRNDRFWIMEHQPGPVNWATHNPVPAPGMVRLWSWEAMAHGCEVLAYFRWRQFPHAQEQMHAGLHRPDNILSPGGKEAKRFADELKALGPLPRPGKAPVALVFDYEAAWVTRIQPQGADFDYRRLVHLWYEAARRLGVDVDVVAPGVPLDGYAAVLVPSLPIVTDTADATFRTTGAHVLFGPRTGSKTRHFGIPETLPPGPLQDLLPIKIIEVASLPPDIGTPVDGGTMRHWREHIELQRPDLVVDRSFADGTPALVRHHRFSYLAGWAEPDLLRATMMDLFERAGIEIIDLPEHIRLRRLGHLQFAFNYGSEPWTIPVSATDPILGSRTVAPHDLSCWSTAASGS